MKKNKVFLGSIAVAILMLVTTQIAFFQIVKSDPDIHYGDANTGTIWISELNVSDATSEFDYLGIAHVNATNEWVTWNTSSIYNVNATWAADIDSTNHPEYYVIYSMRVLHINGSDITDLGNDSHIKTYNINQTYSESGTLSVEINTSELYNSSPISETLVAQLGAIIRINDTEKATNFSSTASDRCVIGVESEWPRQREWPIDFVEEANENLPAMWSWLDDWDSYFTTEEEMLNNQTYLMLSDNDGEGSSANSNWYMGHINLTVPLGGLVRIQNFDVINSTVDWEPNEDSFYNGSVNISYKIEMSAIKYPVRLRFKFHAKEPIIDQLVGWGFRRYLPWIHPSTGDVKGFISAHESGDCNPLDSYIELRGRFWAGAHIPTSMPLTGFKIHMIQNGSNNGSGSDEAVDWVTSTQCAYTNYTDYSASISSVESGGITTVSVNILNIIKSGDNQENVYTFRGDTGNTQVQFTCSN